MDHALIMKSLRGSMKERRDYVEKKHNGSVKELVSKLPILAKAEYVSIQFKNSTCIRPQTTNLKKNPQNLKGLTKSNLLYILMYFFHFVTKITK